MSNATQQSETTTLRFSDTFEGRQVELLKGALAKAVEAGGWVAVDLAQVEALSPEAIDTLRQASDVLERIGGRLLIINPAAPVPKALEFKSFHKLLQQTSSVKTDERITVETGNESW